MGNKMKIINMDLFQNPIEKSLESGNIDTPNK
jgi:hypothetical protein